MIRVMGVAFPEGINDRGVVTVDSETANMEALAAQPHDNQLDCYGLSPAFVLVS